MITEHAYDDEELKGYPQGEHLDSIFCNDDNFNAQTVSSMGIKFGSCLKYFWLWPNMFDWAGPQQPNFTPSISALSWSTNSNFARRLITARRLIRFRPSLILWGKVKLPFSRARPLSRAFLVSNFHCKAYLGKPISTSRYFESQNIVVDNLLTIQCISSRVAIPSDPASGVAANE